MRLLANQLGSDKFASHPLRDEWMRPDKHGVSILHLAAQDPSTELLEFLVPLLQEKKTSTTLLGHTFESLLNHGDKENKTALHYACEANGFDHIVILINLGADMYVLDEHRNTFLTWFEKNNPPFFDRLQKDKQLQLLSYFRRRVKQDGEAQTVYAKLAADYAAMDSNVDVDAELDQHDKTHLKTLPHVLDEDRRTIERLIKKADAHLANLNARPTPPFNRRLYWILGIVSAVLTGSMPIAVFVLIIMGAVSALSVLLAGIVLNPCGAVSISVGVSGVAIVGVMLTAMLFGNLTGYLFRKGPPQVPISSDELSEFKEELDSELMKKCQTIEGEKGVSALPVAAQTYLSLKSTYGLFKIAISTVASAIFTLKWLKSELEAFLKEMLENKKPFSNVPDQAAQVAASTAIDDFLSSLINSAQAAPTTENTEKQSRDREGASTEIEDASIESQSPEALPPIAAHWASFHQTTQTVTAIEVADIDDLEMAHSAFGQQRSL